MKCEESREALSWAMDGELGKERLAELEAHVGGCPDCEAFRAVLNGTDAAIRETFESAQPSSRFRVKTPRRIRWRRTLGMAAALLLVLVGGSSLYVNTLSPDPLRVSIHGSTSLHADSMGSLRVFVQNGLTGHPVPDAVVRILIAGNEVGQFVTSATGSIDGSFHVPDMVDGDYLLQLEVDSPIGRDTMVRSVTVRREYRLLLTTDKPMYKPGQTIHLRAMALNAFTLKPRPGEATFEVQDSKGNRIFREEQTLSEFGIGSIDFELADEVNLGTYRISVTASGIKQERTVEVAKYVLPKFKVELELAKPSTRPGEVLRGTLRARYFFGKPVHGVARIKIGRETVSGELREDGSWEFQAVSPRAGNWKVEATVTDTADHVETKTTIAIVSAEPLKVTLVPEGGGIVQGIENTFYLIVAMPNGRPARADLVLDINGKRTKVTTDDLGVAKITAKSPYRINLVRARDMAGNETILMRSITGVSPNDFLIRLDKTSYKGGETMTVKILGASRGPVYVDLVKGGQLILAKAVIGDTLEIDLPPELFGTLHVLAYRRETTQPVVRVAYVNLPEGLQIRPRLAKETFRPGEEMEVEFEVVDRDGKPVQAALGLAVVDEALFGLVASKLASEKAWLSLAPELIDTRGFLEADPEAIFSGANTNAQAFVSGNGSTTIPQQILNNPFEVRAKKLEIFVGNFNKVIKEFLKIAGVIFLVILAGWFLYLLGNELRKVPYVAAAVSIVLFLALLAMFLLPSLSNPLRHVRYHSAWGGGSGLSDSTVASPPMARMPGTTMALPPDTGTVTVTLSSQAPTTVLPPPPSVTTTDTARPRKPVRVREYFPETLFWMPQLITDERGRAKVTLPAADSITSWRMLTNAISRNGALGFRQTNLRVFQDFFADIDFPVALTKGDRVHIPVAVYNYLKEPQSIAVRVEQESWFELLDKPSKTIALKAGEVSVVYFGLRVKEHGRKSLTVYAEGRVSDALRRSVEIMEKGREVPVSISDRITGKRTFGVTIPDNAIEGASIFFVRLTPGMSDQVTGLEGLIRMPDG